MDAFSFVDRRLGLPVLDWIELSGNSPCPHAISFHALGSLAHGWQYKITLDTLSRLFYKRCMSPKLYTSREAAEAAGISHGTLYAWLAAKKIAPPALATGAGVKLWTTEDIDRLKRKKKEIYQKGHPRKSDDKR